MELPGIIWGAVEPLIVEIAAAVALAVVSYLTKVLRDRWQIEIEAAHREALHSALQTGILDALRRAGVPLNVGLDGELGESLIFGAVAYARRSVPDAIRRLDPGDRTLREIAGAKLSEAMIAAR